MILFDVHYVTSPTICRDQGIDCEAADFRDGYCEERVEKENFAYSLHNSEELRVPSIQLFFFLLQTLSRISMRASLARETLGLDSDSTMRESLLSRRLLSNTQKIQRRQQRKG